eukprot:36388-Amphidinium_carterae.1
MRWQQTPKEKCGGWQQQNCMRLTMPIPSTQEFRRQLSDELSREMETLRAELDEKVSVMCTQHEEVCAP